MFRYGGPIKEGVMSGIREPKKDGGPTGTGLVGDQRYPKTNGREHHAVFIPPLVAAGAGIARLAPLAMRAARPVVNFFRGTAPATVRKGLGRTRVPTTTERMSSLFKTSPAGKYLMGSPEGRLITGGAGYAGKAGEKILQGGKYLASSPLTLATAGYYGGKALLPDGTPNPNAPGGPEGPPRIINPPGGKKGSASKDTGGGVELSAEELRKERIQKYRDIMDIKGMNKDAAYKSLISASQLINQSGDFKGDIKSGKLINEIIQATSKNFDKPKATKDAIDTLILKGEIEKDLNKEKNALDNEYKRSSIALNEAKIAQDSLMGDRKSYLEKNKTLPSGQLLAGLARNRGYQVSGIEDVTEVKNWMKENGGDEIDYLKDTMTKTEIAPGVYVINTRLIQVTEDNKLQEV